jgi:exodeoxyribonuclease VII large subunit
MFVNRNRAVQFKPENGKQVIVKGRLSIYEGRGDYQLIVDGMEEAGAGALQKAFEQLKAKLLAEGLFAEEHKQQIHTHYRHIGIITSATGAAIQDMLSVFARRFPATRITLLPVAVQGKEAADEIVNAIQTANKLANKLGLQALIISRGGGSLEDLQAFNEEHLARAVFASKLPVCSAVGHEVDFTIADFVADLRAPTPSAAAEQMSPDQQDYYGQLFAYDAQLQSAVKKILKQGAQHLLWLSRQLKHPGRRLQEQAQNLDRLDMRLRRSITHCINTQKAELSQRRRSMLASSPQQLLIHSKLRLDTSRKQLQQSLNTMLTSYKSNLGLLSRSLHSVSPLNTLARGYSITYDDSAKVIRSSDDVRVGSTIISKLDTGEISSVVESVSKKRESKP